MEYSYSPSKETPLWKQSRFWIYVLLFGFMICGAILSGPTLYYPGSNLPSCPP